MTPDQKLNRFPHSYLDHIEPFQKPPCFQSKSHYITFQKNPSITNNQLQNKHNEVNNDIISIFLCDLIELVMMMNVWDLKENPPISQ